MTRPVLFNWLSSDVGVLLGARVLSRFHCENDELWEDQEWTRRSIPRVHRMPAMLMVCWWYRNQLRMKDIQIVEIKVTMFGYGVHAFWLPPALLRSSQQMRAPEEVASEKLAWRSRRHKWNGESEFSFKTDVSLKRTFAQSSKFWLLSNFDFGQICLLT